jgi:hypothetical protein
VAASTSLASEKLLRVADDALFAASAEDANRFAAPRAGAAG